VDSIRVEYYGQPTPLKQLAQITTPDPQQIVIRPYDQGVLKDVEKAIRSSDLGLSPNSDGKLIRAKVACRNIRRDANKHLDQAEKDKDLTEDECDQGKEEVQTLLKKFEEKIGELADKKAKEILEQ
jgi:ribosome recycling factor